MEVHFPAKLEAKLQEMGAETGRGKDDFLQDAFAGYFAEMTVVRELIGNRYRFHRQASANLQEIWKFVERE